MKQEARIMDYVRLQGFPVPAVDEVSSDGLDMVLERIEGADMVATMEKRPWTIRQMGRTLADLHRDLHALTAPDWLPDAPIGRGISLLHLDLHPLNVMIGPRGPVVIDWARACRGDAAVDVALAWILTAAGEVPTSRLMAKIVSHARSALVKSFLGSVQIDAVRPVLRDVVAWKASDPHISAAEQARMWELVEQTGRGMPA
jgi:aminoglycoside phosphotransferase (APT) family kinase protein